MAAVDNDAERIRSSQDADAPDARPVAEIESRVLLGDAGRVRILHRGQTYELRETRYGKLILTK